MQQPDAARHTKRRDWHSSPFGVLACLLGDVRTAIPALVLTAFAMAWGTWIESTHDAETAKRVVYASWWFIALMIWICLSLIFAVVVRFPWQKRHTGFIIVHAGLITIIVGGFVSLFTKVEGMIVLREGMSTNTLELPREQVQWITGPAGRRAIRDAAPVHRTTDTIEIGGQTLRLVERWANCIEESSIKEGGSAPFQAVQFGMPSMVESHTWISETTTDAAAFFFSGVRYRVLPAGEDYTPRQQPESSEPFFLVGAERWPLAAVGAEVTAGWTIESIDHFVRPDIDADGLVETEDGEVNPAIRVILTNGEGSRERHIAFQQFPDMPLSRLLAGEEASGASLLYPSPPETRFVFDAVPEGLRVVYEPLEGEIEEQLFTGEPPWDIGIGGKSFRIFQHYEHAYLDRKLTRAPAGDRTLPVLVLQPIDAPDAKPIQLPWKSDTPANILGLEGTIRYVPQAHRLPFELRLEDFRKMDYPGSDMAMAYESDVSYRLADTWRQQRIWMNNPLVVDGWKVYQSGFDGDDISSFSVAKDPGLLTTYIGCVLLCAGILVIFYLRPYSKGHPGIPMPGAGQGA
jgi:ResB-like family